MIDTGLLLGLAGMMLTFIGLMVKIAMDYQKTKGDIDTLNSKVCDHIAYNEKEHDEFFKISEKLTKIEIKLGVLIGMRMNEKGEDDNGIR